jgi:hypothetical protein
MIFQISVSVLNVSPKGGIGLTTMFSQPLRTKPCFPNASPGLRLPGAKRDQPEQGVIVVAIDPNFIGKGAAMPPPPPLPWQPLQSNDMKNLLAFLGDGGEVRMGAFQFAFRRPRHALQRRHGFIGGELGRAE